MAVVVLGNRNAVESTDNGATFTPMAKGKRATRIEVPDEFTLAQAFTAITAPGGVWATQAEAGSDPAWVASDDSSLAALLSDHFGGATIRDLEEN